MTTNDIITTEKFLIGEEGLQGMITALLKEGYRVCGPTVSEGAILYEEMESAAFLPRGWRDEQESGSYEIRQEGEGTMFGYTVGPHSWKKFLYPSRSLLFEAARDGKSFTLSRSEESPPRYAFIGVRSCDLHALEIHDGVFMKADYVDPAYGSRREQLFIIAVNCTRAGGTCFCVSMRTGPKVEAGFDLSLTELPAGESLRFLVEIGSERGKRLMEGIESRPASEAEIGRAEELLHAAASSMGRSVDTGGIRELLHENAEHPRWDDIAHRCMTCANCTLVCPTCFCSTVEDTTDLTGGRSERWRRWDSCFTLDFAKVVGGNFRPSAKARYRQWLTHKFASWIDQFGVSGCVGCGRCITWCPVGIDVTAEIEAIRSTTRQDIQQPKGI